MSDSQTDHDDQIALKKRARRRLIGAAVFATTAAVVLPMVMDREPPPALPNIELRIPAQEKGFVPPPTRAAVPTVAEPVPVADAAKPAVPAQAPSATPTKPADAPKAAEAAVAKAAAEPATKPKTVAEPAAKPKAESKPAPKVDEKKPGTAREGEARRAQAILDGQDKVADAPHVVLIGAFANPGNVENIRKKLSEMGIKVYTEALDSPQGKKTRVRAGPFPNREAAEKAAARMKSIGVGGVVAAKS